VSLQNRPRWVLHRTETGEGPNKKKKNLGRDILAESGEQDLFSRKVSEFGRKTGVSDGKDGWGPQGAPTTWEELQMRKREKRARGE
jgi:hypothetical protein